MDDISNNKIKTKKSFQVFKPKNLIQSKGILKNGHFLRPPIIIIILLKKMIMYQGQS